jgi:biotin operon repressor
MLANKKYYFAVEPTKSCQLSFAARWVYSFLVFRTSLNKPASGACIFRNLGICNRAVKEYLGELRDAGLLAEVNDYYLASDPGEHWQWFVQKNNGENLPWFQRFATYAVYVPNPHQKLPLTHSALLSLVWSLRHGSGWITIRPAGLATMLFPEMNRASAKRQINRAAKNLRDKGLLDDRWNVTVQPEHHHYWRDADHLANPRSRSDCGEDSLREYVLGSLKHNGYECYYCFPNNRELGMHLDRCEQAMKRAGYNQRQILDYWGDVVYEPGYCNRLLALVEVFAGKGFMAVFKMAEEMTTENRISKGYVGISLGLLRKLTQYEMLTIKDMAAKKNSNGESLLRYYEPNHERLRGSAGSAA